MTEAERDLLPILELPRHPGRSGPVDGDGRVLYLVVSGAPAALRAAAVPAVAPARSIVRLEGPCWYTCRIGDVLPYSVVR